MTVEKLELDKVLSQSNHNGSGAVTEPVVRSDVSEADDYGPKFEQQKVGRQAACGNAIEEILRKLVTFCIRGVEHLIAGQVRP